MFRTNNTHVANFSIGCDRSWKTTVWQKHTDTEWLQGLAWGSQVDIKGLLQSRTWQNKGRQNQRSFKIAARDLILLKSQH